MSGDKNTMDNLKTIALIYECQKERLCKHVLSKLMFYAQCFVFIPIDHNHENTYILRTNSDVSEILEKKISVAHEIFVINPKGSIAPYLTSIMNYASEQNKAVHYMYRYCYPDCTHRKTNGCTLPADIFWVPHSHKLLPACQYYSRIYDNFLIDQVGGAPALADNISDMKDGPTALQEGDEILSLDIATADD